MILGFNNVNDVHPVWIGDGWLLAFSEGAIPSESHDHQDSALGDEYVMHIRRRKLHKPMTATLTRILYRRIRS